MAALRIVVRGRVQGVGFRYFVSRQASEYGVRGEVWNLRDGGVEVAAENESEQILRDFADALHEGPGHVVSVNAEEILERPYRDFSIGPTR